MTAGAGAIEDGRASVGAETKVDAGAGAGGSRGAGGGDESILGVDHDFRVTKLYRHTSQKVAEALARCAPQSGHTSPPAPAGAGGTGAVGEEEADELSTTGSALGAPTIFAPHSEQ